MIDWRKAFREFLLDQPDLYALTGERIYASSSLDKGYKPSSGVAIQFNNRGGGENDSGTVLRVALQIRVYGPTLAAINQADKAFHDIFKAIFQPDATATYPTTDTKSILSAKMEQPSQQLELPEPLSWQFMLGFYTINFRNN